MGHRSNDIPITWFCSSCHSSFVLFVNLFRKLQNYSSLHFRSCHLSRRGHQKAWLIFSRAFFYRESSKGSTITIIKSINEKSWFTSRKYYVIGKWYGRHHNSYTWPQLPNRFLYPFWSPGLFSGIKQCASHQYARGYTRVRWSQSGAAPLWVGNVDAK